jgi:apolipoprotein N-acyltransferase
MKRGVLLLLSVLSGLLMALSWPENGITLLMFVAWVPLLIVQQELGDSRRKGVFLYAFLTFFIWNILTTWWIWNSTGAGAVGAWVLNSLFMASVFYVFHLSKVKLFNNKRGTAILLFYWITWEYFHMNWELTWPWLSLGNVFASHHKWIQWYEYTGMLGGTVWVFLVNFLLFTVVRSYLKKNGKRLMLNLSGALLMLILPVVWSYHIYNNYSEEAGPVEVVVVQPNIDPYNEEFTLPAEVILERNLKLAKPLITDSTRFVISPESAIQEGIWEHLITYSSAVARIKRFIKPHPGLSYVIGASTWRMIGNRETMTNAARKLRDSDRYYYSYNTAFLIDNRGQVQIHHKSKLTPGVERMPSYGILKPLEKLAIDLGGVSGTLGWDDKPVVFKPYNDDVKVAPVICYESVYGEYVAQYVKEGAELIFVITNDGWWGDTPGYRQHLLFSVLRAIETRRDVARSANTGVSAIINQKGDILQKTKYWVPAALKAKLNSNDRLTFYVAFGDYIARIASFVSALVLLISFVQGFLKKRKSSVV